MSADPSAEDVQAMTFNINAAIHAPFNGLDESELEDKVTRFVDHAGLDDYINYFLKAGFVAQSDDAFNCDPGDGPLQLSLSAEERLCLKEEKSRRWKHPGALWRLVALCALGAAVQGWDEAAVDGAQIYYTWAFGIGEKPTDRNLHYEIITGFVNSAPYLCCAFSCWLTQPLNNLLGRRGTIFLACLFSAAFCLGQAFSWNWKIMFTFRFLLGLGIGPKSATIPIYASECAPANIRGALVMMWQVFTAFGIMCGFFSGAAFRSVLRGYQTGENMFCEQKPGNSSRLLSTACSLNWRLMIGSPMVAPIILAMYIYTQPESPRWLLAKAHKAKNDAEARMYYSRVFQSLTVLRHSKLQAARDMMLIHFRLCKEEEVRATTQTVWYKRGVFELFSTRRNRRAVIASLIVMFFQQFCGINVLIYYSSFVLEHNGYPAYNALLYSMGIGIINFTCALPAFHTIDTFGRRNLLLVTFPLLALFQLLNAISFIDTLPDVAKTRLIIAGMYLFSIAYSPGEGPVPFVYSAESMPLYIRDLGMGFVTSINWLFNFVIAVTLPSYLDSFKGLGTFMWYFGWCIVGWFVIFTFVPETRGKELEELDAVFETSTWHTAHYYWKHGEWVFRYYFMHQRGRQPPALQPPEEKPTELRPVKRRTTHLTVHD